MDQANRERLMDKIAILIINHETPEETQRLITTIQTHFNPDNFDLTVVDNSLWYPLEQADISHSYNKGFDQVVIDWLKESKSKDYLGYWTLNSDCILKPKDYTETIIKYLQDTRIGLISTVVHEPKAPGWGDTSPLQNPQNLKRETDAKVGYIDFQSAIISRGLLNSFPFDNDLVYFLGGLDVDFNLCCEQYNLFKVVINELELIHLGAQSYREPDGQLVKMKRDEYVHKDEYEHMKKLHLTDFIISGDQLMAYGIKKRYNLDLASERMRMIDTVESVYKNDLAEAINENA